MEVEIFCFFLFPMMQISWCDSYRCKILAPLFLELSLYPTEKSGVTGIVQNGKIWQIGRTNREPSIIKSVLKAQEIIPHLSGGHVWRHDLLTTALMPTTEERLSNNVTSG